MAQLSPDTLRGRVPLRSITWYGRTPDANARETSVDGIAGIVPLDPGQVEVTLVRAATDELVGRARVWVRPDEITWIYLGPRSRSGE